MGSSASVHQTVPGGQVAFDIVCTLTKIREAMEEAIFVREKWPLIVDPSGQAARFLSYQPGNFVLALSPVDMMKDNLRRCLVGSLGHGSMMTMCFNTLDIPIVDIFEEGKFPMSVLDRSQVFKEEFWAPLMTPEEKEDFEPQSSFCFCVVTKEGVNAEMATYMTLIQVLDNSKPDQAEEEVLADICGAKEEKKNSKQMVEAAFDGDFQTVKEQIEKGFDLESVDGSKHTSLSEASAQGHNDIVRYLLELGANPNNVNNKNRTPVWRAAYNGHFQTVQLLLEAGCDPRQKDSTSMEGPFDVAKNDETRKVLQEWQVEKTDQLISEWRERRRLLIEASIKTAAEREAYEKGRLRDEMLEYVKKGDCEGLKTRLQRLAEECDSKGGKIIATADTIRDSRGLTLLALATENDNVEMVTMLLTHWKEIEDENKELGLDFGDSSAVKIFKANPNSRDAKGWNVAATAVFAQAKRSLKILLGHGADPHVKSSYNKSAWDLAQDELDAALKVVKSKADIRKVIEDWESATSSTFLRDGSPVKDSSLESANPVGEGPADGSAAMLAVEVAEGSGKSKCKCNAASKSKGKKTPAAKTGPKKNTAVSPKAKKK